VRSINFKFIGGLLLIIGTSIGAGMLALPIATAQAGVVDTTFAFIIAWAFMLFGALFILEVNLWLPAGSNMISMASHTLGPVGKWVTWFSYLFLLYTLLCGYIAGGGDVFHALLQGAAITPPQSLSTILYVLLFALVVFSGMKHIDQTNRLLMYIKITAFFVLVGLISPHIELSKLTGGELKQIKPALMLLFTAFGFAIIVPSLRDYFDSDSRVLRKLVIVGSCFPLLCYILWNAVIMGVIPRVGHPSLHELLASEHATSELATVLAGQVGEQHIGNLFKLFSGISMLTAFLGVSLCLYDFLADGLSLAKKGAGRLMLLLLVFLPPLLVVLMKPGIYIQALNYAGFFCLILLLLLPALMVLRGRYQKQLQGPFTTFGGAYLPLLTAILACLLSGYAIVSALAWLFRA